ncbi:argininosuccinate lyase [Candidatus Micrarchaeota archaeon]|nr:argininosuccinate lyase [Candidatus Micrarchaeota archaeon]
MLWRGRFSKSPDKDILKFNSAENIVLDEKLVPYDILGSIAHVKMLKKQGILKENEAAEIVNALEEIKEAWEKGKFKLDEKLEDVHMNIETAVSKKTEHGKKMHTARSRNDQVLLDMRLYMRDEVACLKDEIKKLQKSFADISKKEPVVGYTHTRVAQPITIEFWCDAYTKSLQRDIERLGDCFKRINMNPLGACALAGTSWKIDREYTAKLLGFEKVQDNELDTISSRGECEAELLSALSIIMAKLSGIAEELIWLSQKGLVELPDEFCTGSSIMPNKKNPDALELIRGRTARVHSNLMHVLSVKKALISGYHSDMQETKFAVMSGIETTMQCIAVLTKIVKKLEFNQEEICKELDEGFAQATKIADYLAMNGISFREAHEKTGKLVKHCEKKKITLSQLDHKSAEELLGINIEKKQWDKLISL